MDNSNETQLLKHYRPLSNAAGFGSMLGSGIIVTLASTITVWQKGLQLTNSQVGIISGILTFAIAFGSLFGGKIAESIGLIKSFNWINLFYAVGAALCVFSNGFLMLVCGVTICGFTSGMDLPVSLAVVSHDAPDKEISNKLVAFTQVYWQIGAMSSVAAAFIVSKVQGDLGARIVFGALTLVALITWAWRTFSPTFRQFHIAGDAHWNELKNEKEEMPKASVVKVLFGSDKKYLRYFSLIMLFYVLWNLLANTWGQFGTFMLVKAHASQSIATGSGVVIGFVGILVTAWFSKVSSGSSRNPAFIVGSLISFVAYVILGLFGTHLTGIITANVFTTVGGALAGEAMYKVWTQESFPVDVRASIQGIINGTSRLACALFAFITPALVIPARIQTTMWVFSGLVILYLIAAIIMMRAQKNNGVEE